MIFYCINFNKNTGTINISRNIDFYNCYERCYWTHYVTPLVRACLMKEHGYLEIPKNNADIDQKKIIYEDFVLKPSKAWSFFLKNTCARINNYLNLDARVRGISALLFKLSTDATYYTKWLLHWYWPSNFNVRWLIMYFNSFW